MGSPSRNPYVVVSLFVFSLCVAPAVAIAQNDNQYDKVIGSLANLGHDGGRSYYRKGFGARALLQAGEGEGEAQMGEPEIVQEVEQVEAQGVAQSQGIGGGTRDQVGNSRTEVGGAQAQAKQPAAPQKKLTPHLSTVKGTACTWELTVVGEI
eukprot:219339-Pyramimonas_sp.AAC.1